MKKLIAFIIIINVFLSSALLLRENDNGIYIDVLTNYNNSEPEESNNSKNPLTTELLSEKEDSKSDVDLGLKNLAFNPAHLSFKCNQLSKFLVSNLYVRSIHYGNKIPFYITNRSILI